MKNIKEIGGQVVDLHRLAASIKNASCRNETSIKPPEITRFSCRGDLGKYLLALFNLYHQQGNPELPRLLLENPDLGFWISRSDIRLESINICEVLKRRKLPPILEHRGCLTRWGMDNVLQLQKHGIFGSVEITDPTYIKSIDSPIQPASIHDVTVFIDPAILMEYRTLFCDPEQLLFAHERPMLGQGFLILGGIPAQAILRIGEAHSSFSEASPVNI